MRYVNDSLNSYSDLESTGLVMYVFVLQYFLPNFTISDITISDGSTVTVVVQLLLIPALSIV